MLIFSTPVCELMLSKLDPVGVYFAAMSRNAATSLVEAASTAFSAAWNDASLAPSLACSANRHARTVALSNFGAVGAGVGELADTGLSSPPHAAVIDAATTAAATATTARRNTCC
ncbi:hypothetical protein ACFQHO_53160 [Actinomadura yumaensis]|uniref:hypothetical protein n=1 Tax=Actinomadura yumaensis TaxID=111807 RepID=UPI0036091DBB